MAEPVIAPVIAPIVQGSSANIVLDSKTLEQCLKTTNAFGHTVYTNVCTGIQTAIPWGGLDWAVILLLLAVGVSVVGAIIFLILYAILDGF